MWLSVTFVEKARNKLLLILSNSESANQFAEALKMLPRHARDEHKWDEVHVSLSESLLLW